MIRALAAMKRFDEIDGLITTSHSLEVPAAPVWLMNTAMLEARLHGADSAARRYATRSLAALDQQSDSIKGTIAGRNALRSALRTLGDQKAVVAAYDEELRMQGNRGLGNRILAMRDRVLMGDTAGALVLVKSVREQPMSSFAGSAWNVKGAPRYYAAQILALLGKKDEAVALLRDALNNGWRIFGDEERQWFWAPIKDYPPFLELMKVR